MLTAFSKYVSGYLLPNKPDQGAQNQVNGASTSRSQKCRNDSTESLISPPLADFVIEGQEDDSNEWVVVIDSDDNLDSGLFDDVDRQGDNLVVRPLNQWEDAMAAVAMATPISCNDNERDHVNTPDEGIHSPMVLSLRDNLDLKFHDRWDRRDRKKNKIRIFNMAAKEAARQQRTDKALERLSVSSSGADESADANFIVGMYKRDRRGGKKKSHRAGKEMPKYQQNILEEGALAIEANMTKLHDMTNEAAGQGIPLTMNGKKQRGLKKSLSPKPCRYETDSGLLDMVFKDDGDKENASPKQKLSFFYKNKSAKRNVKLPQAQKCC